MKLLTDEANEVRQSVMAQFEAGKQLMADAVKQAHTAGFGVQLNFPMSATNDPLTSRLTLTVKLEN